MPREEFSPEALDKIHRVMCAKEKKGAYVSPFWAMNVRSAAGVTPKDLASLQDLRQRQFFFDYQPDKYLGKPPKTRAEKAAEKAKAAAASEAKKLAGEDKSGEEGEKGAAAATQKDAAAALPTLLQDEEKKDADELAEIKRYTDPSHNNFYTDFRAARSVCGLGPRERYLEPVTSANEIGWNAIRFGPVMQSGGLVRSFSQHGFLERSEAEIRQSIEEGREREVFDWSQPPKRMKLLVNPDKRKLLKPAGQSEADTLKGVARWKKGRHCLNTSDVVEFASKFAMSNGNVNQFMKKREEVA